MWLRTIILGSAAVVVVVVLTVVLAAGGGAQHAQPKLVDIVSNPNGVPDSLYRPGTITVRAGTTVKWVDQDDMEHTVSPDRMYAGWHGGSSILRHGQTYTWTFSRAGVYRYHCMVHANMFGTVVVLPPVHR